LSTSEKFSRHNIVLMTGRFLWFISQNLEIFYPSRGFSTELSEWNQLS
jgi:hypothetical protein